MSVYEEIINGTYKKKKESVYESIINGTYETQSQIAERKKQEQQAKLDKVSNYQNTKKTAMKQIGTQIKQQSETKKKQEEIINNEIKNQVNNINTNFNKANSQNIQLPTAKNTSSNKINNNAASNYRNTALQEAIKKILPTKKDNKEASKSDIKVSSKPIKDISGITKSSDAFDDGYQFGDVSKTIGSTLANAGASFIEGIGRIGEGASDFGTHVAAQVVDWAGNKEWANRIRKTAIEDRNKELFDNIQNGIKGNSVLGNKGTETLASMGYSTGLMAFEMNPLTSKIGTGLMFSSASAGGLNDSYSKEGVTNTQAWIRGLGQGAIETAVERASGLFGSVGSWDRSLSNAISSRISSGFGKLLVRTGVQGLAEGSEEIVSYTLNKIFDKAINKVSNGKGATFSEEWNWEELGEQIGIAFLSASLMGMGSTAYEVGQIVNNDKLNLAQAINEAGLRSDVKAQAELLNEDIENIKKQLKKNPNNTELTNELKSKYAQMNELVTNNVFLQDKTNIKEDEAQLRLQEAQDIINNAQNGQRQANNTTNLQTQQTIQQGNKTAQNQTSVQIENNYITEEFKQGIEKFNSKNYDQTDNIQVLNKLPQYFYNFGYEINQPLYLNMYKLKDIMKQPKGTFKGVNQHGITMDIIEQLPKALNNPLNVIKNPKFNNRFVIITDLTDQYGDIIVVPVELKNDNNAEITSISKINSIYGKDTYDIPYKDENQSYMGKNKNNIVYDIDNERSSSSNYRLQLPSETKTTSTNSITPSNENVKPTNYSMQNEQNNTQILPIQNNTQKQNASYNLPIDENTKSRKHYKSIIQSQYTTDEAKAISKELMKTDTYVPESNNKQLERADKRIELSGADSELDSLMSRAMTGGNIKADDIAVGERLIQYYSKTGNKAKLQEAIQATAMAGTTAGQTVQAMSLLNHQTPEGQAVWLQRSVDKMNNDLVKARGEKAEQFNLTPEMTEKIINSKGVEELQNNLNEVYEELGQQVTKTTLQKIDAWRYFSMLANPRTHIRNIVGNTAMSGIQYGIKNKIAGSIESVVSKINPEMERTHTIVPASKEVKQFAKNDIKNVADRLGLNENKYNPKTRLENSMRTFKSDAMENTFGKLFELNDKALEAEDGWGLKAGYTKALSEYMTANKLTPENITDKQLAKARNYAIEQAQEATFHQASAIATALNQFQNKNKFTKFITDATLPFKKTPINVAKAGLEYSPIGLVKSAIYDTVQLRKGNITVNKYIDNISKGLTGTGIALVGYALANAGILKASGSDDKDKESYDEDRGYQTYSIQIGDNTYSLDWLAPTGIPLFIGAECYEIMQTEKETKTSSSDEDSSYNQAIKSATNILDACTNAMNPMTEMSMLSGLTSALKSYDGDNSKMLANLGINATKSYVNQFIPTALGQIAKTTDEYERSTTSTKTGTLPKAIDSTKNYAMSKIPGLRQMLPTKTDVWGNELKQSDNVVQRALENAALPWTRKEVSSNIVDKELSNVYNNTGESSVLPDSINKNLTINKQKYVMTSEEYAKYKKQYGQNSYKLLNSLVTSTQYKKLSNSQKQIAIEKVYEYAKEQIKIDYAKNNNLDYKESKLSETLNALKTANANTSNYLEYIALTKDMEKTNEKITVLANSNFTDKTKQLIYENYIKSENDSQYSAVKASEMDITEYLKFKTQEFESDKKEDGTLTGKTVSNSKKTKVVEYLNSMKITGNQRLLLYAMQGYTTTSSQKAQLANYVNGLKLNKQEKLKLYDKFSGFTVYKNGTVKW